MLGVKLSVNETHFQYWVMARGSLCMALGVANTTIPLHQLGINNPIQVVALVVTGYQK